ncbi:hypothetical protein BDY21DRAFT_294173 [Lineolata rhizophorae]|uniref:DUF6697 domain-containing protein n=1 Tax=Lineolata rhizophorae TaxID=578093 RepID=A0A6A6NMZ6_9PEZI|nr:hypothetical protein BDY21DRAFT_294173 [Lineolata rhizophorae]
MKDTGIETFDTLPVDKWQPLAVRRLPRPPMSQLKNIPLPFETKTFSLDFLQYFFGGFQHTPGMYYIPKKEGHSILPSRSYYLMDSIHEPYLPKGPGEHGAKLTAFFNDNATDFFEDGDRSPYEGVPLFICGSPYMKAQKNSERIQYIYCGHYTQNRWSDKLDYDRMMEQVPNEVREYHAEELCKLGRPGWVTYRLTEHFWPKPQYDGLLPLSIDLDTDKDRQDFLHDVGSYICELHHWQKGLEAKAVRLKKKSIMKAFEAPDAGNPKGLRLWWEYLKCDGWESTFYNLLVKVQERFYAKGLNKRYDDE